MGFKQWCTDAGVIACGSANKASEGGHYYRGMRIHKEMFCAIVFDKLKDTFDNFTNEMFADALINVMDNPSPSSLTSALESDSFRNLFKALTDTDICRI